MSDGIGSEDWKSLKLFEFQLIGSDELDLL